jgi:hypothetical protein
MTALTAIVVSYALGLFALAADAWQARRLEAAARALIEEDAAPE